ncbi:sigma-70 family RNA polymerase sigma factor [Paenibacillus mesophilus]|uniref:sigma-70 family RNA polymerase sigma factor n=1 Tax=Paenibacillus mesophilus TaxID=2582849 RepID=UPI00110F20EF|nr:sigma-70 family RNA polymerase sigma factor [Paenibacillus mesophilus]TMV48200.1 sigma-70 family RNA polymerase sigma factor [Paenibacillus mesophilus]
MDLPRLVRLAQNGDEQAVFELLQLHMNKLYRIAWIYLRNEPDALEALQETSCRAYAKLGTLKQPEFFSTWIVRIMLNVCMDELKRKKRFTPQDVPEIAYTEEHRELKYILEQELERLDPRWKQVVILKYYEGHTLTEISDIMDCPVGTVKSWLHKALSTLRSTVGKEGGL